MMMKNNDELCPFSKSILGKWCRCQHAKLTERCSGKMSCTRIDDLKASCFELDQAFKVNTRFILGLKHDNLQLTHAHLMKIRCGGLLGMQRVLKIDDSQIVDVREVIGQIINTYKSIESFPFDKIVQDIKSFKYRK